MRDADGTATGAPPTSHALTYTKWLNAGVFLDDAMDLVPKPPWSQMQMEEYFQTTMKDAVRHGLTSIHDAAVSPDAIEFFKLYPHINLSEMISWR
jgi:predicted amidohydrolase YtcJ